MPGFRCFPQQTIYRPPLGKRPIILESLKIAPQPAPALPPLTQGSRVNVLMPRATPTKEGSCCRRGCAHGWAIGNHILVTFGGQTQAEEMFKAPRGSTQSRAKIFKRADLRAFHVFTVPSPTWVLTCSDVC